MRTLLGFTAGLAMGFGVFGIALGTLAVAPGIVVSLIGVMVFIALLGIDF